MPSLSTPGSSETQLRHADRILWRVLAHGDGRPAVKPMKAGALVHEARLSREAGRAAERLKGCGLLITDIRLSDIFDLPNQIQPFQRLLRSNDLAPVGSEGPILARLRDNRGTVPRHDERPAGRRSTGMLYSRVDASPEAAPACFCNSFEKNALTTQAAVDHSRTHSSLTRPSMCRRSFPPQASPAPSNRLYLQIESCQI